MVMETPSAQCVGREFVRQYYTLLHEAPAYLHRFYSHNSSFVHGGVEKPGEEQPPVMGQNDIHEKIMSLKFKDCHAKIRQVDSQSTVSSAVVVQVTGELSNNRQPMRRFMQTFVLVPQTPKKYYVHNDIFRYQDEVFHDLDSNVDGTTPAQQQHNVQQEPSQDLQQEGEVEEPVAEPVAAPQSDQAYYDAPQQQPGLSNGTGSELEESSESPDELIGAQPEEVSGEEQSAADPATEEKEEAQAEPPAPAPVDVPQEQQQPPPQEPQKPVSWAALASQRPPQQSGLGNAPAPQQAPRPTKPAMDAAAAGQPKIGGMEAKPQGQRAPRAPRERPGRDNRTAENQENNGGEPRQQQQRMAGPPPPKFSDAHQLFVGNLPHNIEENELKEFFEKDFGKVVEVRINRKSSTNRDVPNFGFVVFQSPDTVQKVLQMRPILLRDEIRLNVEEKKQRGEQGGRPGSGNRMGGRGGGQGMMGGPRGGMGPRGGGGRGGAGGPPRGGAGAAGGGRGFGGRR